MFSNESYKILPALFGKIGQESNKNNPMQLMYVRASDCMQADCKITLIPDPDTNWYIPLTDTFHSIRRTTLEYRCFAKGCPTKA